MKRLNWPILITLSRIMSIPLIFLGLWLNTKVGQWCAACVFILACITDYIDGWIARSFNQVTRLGEFLDPVADKLLVGSTLLLLAGFGHITGHTLIPACVILCRECLISGLRDWMQRMRRYVPVVTLSKWKTSIQLGSITCILLGHHHTMGDPLHQIGVIGLYCAAVITIMSGLSYFARFHLHDQD